MKRGQLKTIFAALILSAMMVSITASAASAASGGELLKLGADEFSNLTHAETALLKFVGSYRSEPGGFALAGG